jgi:hypothetical protein
VKHLPLIIAVLTALLPLPVHSGSLTCDNGIVSVGDSAVDLIMRCGQPAWKDSRSEEVVDRPDRNVKRTTVVNVEEWTYNFGPQQFLRIVIFRILRAKIASFPWAIQRRTF